MQFFFDRFAVAGLALLCGLAAGCRGPAATPTVAYATAPATVSPLVQDDAPSGPAARELAEYLTHAVAHNPGLQATRQDWKAASERVTQAGTLPDPHLRYRHFIDEIETRTGPQRSAIGVTQSFPWFGTLELEGGAAEQEAAAVWARHEGRRLAVLFEVKRAYADYYYLGRAIEIVRRNRSLMAFIESVARARFVAATAEHPDIIRAQIELGRLDDRLRELEDRRHPLMARLNAALGRKQSGAALPWPETLAYEVLDLESGVARGQLLDWMAEHHPELRALEHEIERAEIDVELADKRSLPQLTVGVEAIEIGGARSPGVSGSGDDALQASVSMSLPLWRGRVHAREREARARQRAAALRREALLEALVAELEEILFELRDTERKIDLYRNTLVPKAAESMRATEGAFRAGTSSFLDLVDAERTLLEFELSYEGALRDHSKNLARLEELVGRPLPLRAAEDAQENIQENSDE